MHSLESEMLFPIITGWKNFHSGGRVDQAQQAEGRDPKWILIYLFLREIDSRHSYLFLTIQAEYNWNTKAGHSALPPLPFPAAPMLWDECWQPWVIFKSLECCAVRRAYSCVYFLHCKSDLPVLESHRALLLKEVWAGLSRPVTFSPNWTLE